jgi:hypothetical protein
VDRRAQVELKSERVLAPAANFAMLSSMVMCCRST